MKQPEMPLLGSCGADMPFCNQQLRTTEDGSHTFYVADIAECYHSTHGAIQESRHIFIKDGFLQCGKSEINVLEVGFGTGLNAYLTLLEAEKTGKTVTYTALELYPLESSQALLLNYPEMLNDAQRQEFEKIHLSSWNERTEISPRFILKKMNVDFTKTTFSEKFDVIYFDAFSPEKQPEMWTEEMFKKLYLCAAQGAVLTTYCCKGAVKRAMKAAGFIIEKLPGPAGKREILRAVVADVNQTLADNKQNV